MHITIIGDAFLDYNLGIGDGSFVMGEDVLLDRPITQSPGGSALNTATHLSALVDTSPHLISFHSSINNSDANGIQLSSHILSNNIPFTNHNSLNLPTAHCVCVSNTSDRGFMSYQGCLEHFDPRSCQIDSKSKTITNHVHIAGYFNLNIFKANDGAALFELLSLLTSTNSSSRTTTVSLVPQFDASNAFKIPKRILEKVDYLILSESEYTKIAPSLRAHRPPYVVVTKGERGATCCACDSPAAPIDKIIDVTGAGDAFCAGFLFKRILHQQPIAESMHFANATAAVCCETVSASAPLDEDRIIAKLKIEVSEPPCSILIVLPFLLTHSIRFARRSRVG